MFIPRPNITRFPYNNAFTKLIFYDFSFLEYFVLLFKLTVVNHVKLVENS
jgi:hypothetical protein